MMFSVTATSDSDFELDRISLRPYIKNACVAISIFAIITANSTPINLRTGEKNIASGEISSNFSTSTGYSRYINISGDRLPTMLNEKDNNFKRIKEIASLGDDWNGNGAKRFSDNIIKKMQEIIETINHQPVVLPTARESIQMEYEKDNGDYLEFELFEDGRLKMFLLDNKGHSETKEIYQDSINEEIDAFYGRDI